jgi:hypothetical protein
VISLLSLDIYLPGSNHKTDRQPNKTMANKNTQARNRETHKNKQATEFSVPVTMPGGTLGRRSVTVAHGIRPRLSKRPKVAGKRA